MGSQSKLYNGPLEEPGAEWFVNRVEELELFWKWATDIPHPGRRSYALIGLRRTGKTAILHKTFNRLFHEQDKVLPVHISFIQYLNRPEPLSAYQFAEEYFAGYVRSFLAFRYRQPELHRDNAPLERLRELARQLSDEIILELFEIYDLTLASKHPSAHSIMQWVINFPKGYAQGHNIPTAMIVDEFQVLTQVYNPDDGITRNLTDSFQHASETRYAPMLVSGSSVSMLVGDALGGLLSGRFRPRHLYGLSQEHTIHMVFRLGDVFDVPVTEELAVAIWELTEGYPYAIESLMNSDSPSAAQLPDVKALNEIVLYEMTHEDGALWGHYEGEYGKYVRQLNGNQNARKILYWITNHPEERIIPEIVAESLNLNILEVRDSLEKLYKTDVIRRAGITTFQGPTDPLMREFLKFEHYQEVDKLVPEEAAADLRKKVQRILGEANRKTGHFAEIIVGGVMNNYDDRSVDGMLYFGLAEPVKLARMKKVLRREGVVKDGRVHEIDIIGEYSLYNFAEGNAEFGAWLVSVRYRGNPMGENEIDAYIHHAAAVQDEKGYGEVKRWYFSKAGFTEGAKKRLQGEGIYFSDLAQFNALTDLFGLLPLSM